LKSKLLGICDTDSDYMERFTEYLNRKEQFPFLVLSFTSPERLQAYTSLHDLEILLISESFVESGIRELHVGKTIVLSEEDSFVKSQQQFAWIYKYQSLEMIIRQLMEYYCEEEGEEPILDRKSKAFMIGVFSPVSRCYKTSFALTLGQLCSKNEATLYLNLEEYSGFSELFKESYTGDLSDAFYYFRQGRQLVPKIHTLIYSLFGLDYIPPIRYPEDLAAFSGSETAEFITELAKTGRYRTIIVDIGTGGWEAAKILEIFDLIYMPVQKDMISEAKITNYEEYLKNSGKEYILKKTRKLELPEAVNQINRGNRIEQLLWGELGDYVRNLMKGDSWKEDRSI